MRKRMGLVAVAVAVVVFAGAALGIAAPVAWAAFGVADDCQNPVNTSCWVAGIYNADYTGMNDRDYLGAPTQDAGGIRSSA
jgi:hypothetical protein